MPFYSNHISGRVLSPVLRIEGLLQKFLSEADESRTGDSHAMASARIKREFADTDQRSLSCVQARALELLHAHTDEMEEKYGKQKAVSNG